MDSFDPWKLVFVKTIDSILEKMDPVKVANMCSEKGLIRDAVANHISDMSKAGRTPRDMINRTLTVQLQGTEIEGYQAFKQILKDVGDPQHKKLLKLLEQKEEEELTPTQRCVLRGESAPGDARTSATQNEPQCNAMQMEEEDIDLR